MVHVRLPKASTRLAPERNHREVMQRARAFRIFEIQCAIVKNNLKAQDLQDTIEHLEDTIVSIESEIGIQVEESNETLNKTVENSEDDEILEKLLAKRNILLERIKYATEKFGKDQVNIGDQKELNVLDTELDRLSRAGKKIVKEKEFTLESKRHRSLVMKRECAKFKEELADLEYMGTFLKKQFETAYDDEHISENEEEIEQGDTSSVALNSYKLASENQVSYLSSQQNSSSVRGTLDSKQTMKKTTQMQVPPLAERDASKFFLLSHVLDYLCVTLSFDLHGKVFYDLSGSRGMIVTAAQYCLQDGGKLTSELDEWMAQAKGLATNKKYSKSGGDISNGTSPSSQSKFAEYKLQKELKKQEALRKAQEEVEAFELAAEQADIEAELEASSLGKITAAELEAAIPKWPFNQVYHTEKDDLYLNELNSLVGEGEDPLSKDMATVTSYDKMQFYGSRPVSALRDVAATARINMAKREESKAARLEELLIRGKAFEYQKTPDPRWSRMVSFESSWENANEAQQLIDLGQPKRQREQESSSELFSPLSSSNSGGHYFPSGSGAVSVPNSPSFGHHGVSSPQPPLSPASSSAASSSSSLHTHQKTAFSSLMDAEAHGIGASSSVHSKASSTSSHMAAQSPYDAPYSNSTTKSVGGHVSRKDPKMLAKSLRRRKSHIEVRETDFVRAGQDWKDGDVVYFDTGSDLYMGIDEGSLIMKLEEFLVKLQPGSFAIIVTRCPYQLINEDSDQLWVVMHTTRLFQGGEKISAWLVKITQPTNPKTAQK